MLVDPDSVTRLLREVAVREILPRFRSLARHEVREKKGGELVTVADVAAERFLDRRLRALLPGSEVVGEEAVAEAPAVLDLLGGGGPVWLVDPIDGTGNFARGRPCFAVMVALVRAGEILAAWIHDPVSDRTAVADSGGGAWMSGRRLRAAPGVPLGADVAAMRGALHAGAFASPVMARHVQKRRHRLHTVPTLRCAGAEYLRLAAGETHFSLFTKMMPWDHAPGVLIHREAGGHGRTLDDQLYDPARRDARGLLLAPDPEAWQALHTTLFGGGPVP